jgi:putative ABC transport system permease protein
VKQIEVADQPRLGFLRTARITLDGVRYRLFRASVTVAVIAMAVAFLMNIVSESLMKRSVAEATHDRAAELRRVYDWASRLAKPPAPEDAIEELAAAEPGDASYAEAQRFAGLEAGAMAEFHHNARTAAKYLAFFHPDNLDYGRLTDLTGRATGVAIFDKLAGGENLAEFERTLLRMRSVRFVTPLAAFETFLEERWPTLRRDIERLRSGRAAAVKKVDAARGDRPILVALSEAEDSFGRFVREAGFELDAAETAPVVAEQARRILARRRIEKSVTLDEPRKAVSRYHDVLPGDVNLARMWEMVRRPAGAAEYLAGMRAAEADVAGLTAERVSRLARERAEAESLIRAQRVTADVGTTRRGLFGLGRRMSWLLFVSMLVCVVGISNAMLMTVTERFREIATMKCLGALDGFIMLMFVLESCLLGLVGGMIGSVLGGGIGLARMLFALGFEFVALVPLGPVAVGMATAVAMGVAMAAVAAVYPALKAARLAPMEAMRIE